MKTLSTKLEESTNGKGSCLSELQNVLADMLILLGVEEDELVGTMLVLKDSVPEQEEMLLYLWDNKPNPTQIYNKLVSMVKARTSDTQKDNNPNYLNSANNTQREC
ncbi:MAG: hypothetical protein IKT00_05330 [Prevotella sp.]|nr:hypothetical protein [Prevotella sp.]